MREIFRLIDWMMRLPKALSREFEQKLAVFEESLNMPYVTSVEQIAEERGIAKVLMKLLARVCGPIPKEVEDRIRQLPLQQLDALTDAAWDFHSLQDVQAWLDTHAGSTE